MDLAREWGIPTLDLGMQATEIVAPAFPYGSVPRGSRMEGTYHFYVDDYKFTRLFANPGRILASGCKVAIEPNCSTGPGVPRAAALFGIYRKRAAAAFWQRHGVKVIVDLNVDRSALDLALLGVPRFWRAYATRVHRGDSLVDCLERWYMAVDHAGTSDLLFVVVGGGKAVKDRCRANGWTHLPEFCRVKRGLEPGFGETPKPAFNSEDRALYEACVSGEG